MKRALIGWDEVEDAIRKYRIMPRSFLADSAAHFAELRRVLCAVEPGAFITA
jgi:hypothetical protein